jgi:regulatory protein
MQGKKPRAINCEDALYEYAVRLLGRKMRTVAELKRSMRMRVEGEQAEYWIESVIVRLKAQRYLNDTEYATAFTRLRQENQKFGRRRVQQDLMVKGVHADVIRKTLEASYEDVKEEELARQFLERKRISKPQDEKETARVVRMLARAGYSAGVIWKVMKAWDIEVDVSEGS